MGTEENYKKDCRVSSIVDCKKLDQRKSGNGSPVPLNTNGRKMFECPTQNTTRSQKDYSRP